MSAIMVPVTRGEEVADRELFHRQSMLLPEAESALSEDNLKSLSARLDPLCCLPRFDLINENGERVKFRHYRVMHTISEVSRTGSTLLAQQQPQMSMMHATVLYCAYCSDISRVNITPSGG